MWTRKTEKFIKRPWKIKSRHRKSPPKRWAFFISVSRDERAHLYTVPVCAQNPEGALRSISDTRAPLRGFCRSHSVTEPPQRLGFPGRRAHELTGEASTPNVYTFAKSCRGVTMLNSTKIKRHFKVLHMLLHFGMTAIAFNISPNAQKCPLSVFYVLLPPIDRSRCLANALRQIYEKGSFEQFWFSRLNGKNHLALFSKNEVKLKRKKESIFQPKNRPKNRLFPFTW